MATGPRLTSFGPVAGASYRGSRADDFPRLAWPAAPPGKAAQDGSLALHPAHDLGAASGSGRQVPPVLPLPVEKLLSLQRFSAQDRNRRTQRPCHSRARGNPGPVVGGAREFPSSGTTERGGRARTNMSWGKGCPRPDKAELTEDAPGPPDPDGGRKLSCCA